MGGRRSSTDELVRTEIALRETEERFSAIFESARDCIFVKDLDLRYTHVNPAMGNLFGRDVAELIGVTDEELFDESTVARVREIDRRVLAGAVEDAVNTSLVEGVEHIFHTVKVPLRDVTGRVTGLCGIARDISDLQRAEQVERVLGGILKAAGGSVDLKTLISRIRELLGTLIDTSNFFVALYDERSGRYSFPYYADSYDSLEEYEQPLPRSLTDYVRRSGQPVLADQDVFAELKEKGEVDLVGTDSELWLGAPLSTDRGVIGVVAVQSYHDSSLYSQKDLELLNYAAGTISIAVERKRADERRRALETKVLQHQKLESLGVLAGGIAHEFNNLLQGILGGTGLAAQLLSPSSPVQIQLDLIEKAANDAAQLTRQMLAYSGKSGLMVEDLDLARLIDEMRDLIDASVGQGVEVRTELSRSLPLITADEAEVQQVVMALVGNASEAIGDDGGVVTIAAHAVECDRDMLADTFLSEDLPEGTYIQLEVSDSGSGMDPRTQAKIFDPFFSTKFAGRGLGLAAVLGIVRGIRGALQVESEPGQGSRFRVLIPSRVERPVDSRGAEASVDRQEGAATVLVVDDDEVVRSLTQQMLEESGYAVVTATDGLQAVEVFKESPVLIDLVLLDMTMPHMDGHATFEKLREIRADIPVVVSTGYNEQDALDRFRDARPTGFLQKPYRLSELVEAMKTALS
jgi:PAS domain S-box-containing protein